jgi:hypothetical protein
VGAAVAVQAAAEVVERPVAAVTVLHLPAVKPAHAEARALKVPLAPQSADAARA